MNSGRSSKRAGTSVSFSTRRMSAARVTGVKAVRGTDFPQKQASRGYARRRCALYRARYAVANTSHAFWYFNGRRYGSSVCGWAQVSTTAPDVKKKVNLTLGSGRESSKTEVLLL